MFHKFSLFVLPPAGALSIGVLLFLLLNAAQGNGQDTLRHVTKHAPLFAFPLMHDNNHCGYLSGQNCDGWEKYAEKYYINNQGTVTGAEIYYTAKVKNLGRLLAFDVYAVGTDGLPKDTLGRKIISYRNMVANGYPLLLTFDTPIAVRDSFFIGINFLDYAHDAFTDTIAIQTSDTLSRPAADLNIRGRNVVVPHHGTWTDFYQLTHIRGFLAMHPIGNLSSNENMVPDPPTGLPLADPFINMIFYPNPVENLLSIQLVQAMGAVTPFKITDVYGNEINPTAYSYEVKEGKLYLHTGALPDGVYIFYTSGPHQNHTLKFVVNKK